MYKDATSGKRVNWYHNISCTEWAQFDVLFEKVFVDGEYKVRIAEMYLNDEALDMNKVISEFGSDILYMHKSGFFYGRQHRHRRHNGL